MPEITFKINQFSSHSPAGIRGRVFLLGLNEFGNGFKSYNSGGFVDASNVPVSPVLAEMFLFGRTTGIDLNDVPFVSHFTFGFGGGNVTDYAVEVMGTANRTVYQVMQQIADFKPTLKKISITTACYFARYEEAFNSLGNLYMGKITNPLEGKSPEFQIINLKHLIKPENISPIGNPQNMITPGAKADMTLECELKTDIKLDGNFVLGIDATVRAANDIFVTLHLN